MASKSCSFSSWRKFKDVLIVDRGFRETIGILEDLGLIPKVLLFYTTKNYYTYKEASKSRLITSSRWVIEEVNG